MDYEYGLQLYFTGSGFENLGLQIWISIVICGSGLENTWAVIQDYD